VKALACPGSLKGVLGAPAAAAALAEGLREGGARAEELPVADGGEGTAEVLARALGGTWATATVSDAFGEPRGAAWLLLPDGTAVVEAAAAIPLDAERRDVLAASSRGFGELLRAALAERPHALAVCLGGTATMDAGEGMREVLDELPVPARVLCDVRTTLWDAPRVFGPQKGASPEAVARLAERLDALAGQLPRDPRGVPGGGAAGGLAGGLWAAFGAVLEPGAPFVLDAVGFDARMRASGAVIVGEGRMDATTLQGKIAGEIAVRARQAGVPCHAVCGENALAPMDQRILDVQRVVEATTLAELEAAGAFLATHL
jgi:glycerate 2-kinase